MLLISQGCIELLHRNGIEISGKSAVVLGRSNIVGIPAALLLLQENATVTVCHSRTKDIEARIRDADILVAAIGKAHFVQGSWIKPGAVVIDVGINSIGESLRPRSGPQQAAASPGGATCWHGRVQPRPPLLPAFAIPRR